MPTLLKCYLKARSRDQIEETTDASGVGKVAITARETWGLIYDGVVTKLAALSATGLPQASYFYNGLVCTRVNPVREANSPNAWEVQVEYATLNPPSGTANNWNIKFGKGYNGRTQTAYTDCAGLPYVNTAGDRLPQQPVDTVFDEAFTISWETTVAPAWASDGYEGCFNTDAVSFTICTIQKTCAPGTLRCVGQTLDCTRTVIGSVGTGIPINRYTFACQMSFQYRRDTWRWSAPNEGWNAWDANHEEKFQISSKKGDPSDQSAPGRTAPSYLDANGGVLADDATPLKLPDDVLDDDNFKQDWRFYIGTSKTPRAFSPLFAGLNDSDQPPPHTVS